MNGGFVDSFGNRLGSFLGIFIEILEGRWICGKSVCVWMSMEGE